jgi:hypothetical protein
MNLAGPQDQLGQQHWLSLGQVSTPESVNCDQC